MPNPNTKDAPDSMAGEPPSKDWQRASTSVSEAVRALTSLPGMDAAWQALTDKVRTDTIEELTKNVKAIIAAA